MDLITSRDSAGIACWQSGTGSPMLLVHGAMSDHTRWAKVTDAFAEHFTVYAVDRRGRGQSGDSPDYSIEKEYHDISAVLDFIGEPAVVLGHSYGATCALGAAFLSDRIKQLVLYEPAILEGTTGFYESERIKAALQLVEDRLDAGEREEALMTIFRIVLEIPEEDIEALKSDPAWPGRVAAVHTVLREMRAEGDWIFEPARFRSLTVPTLLVTGSESYEVARKGTAALHDALPNSRIVVLEGQGHAAITTAPDMFVRTVLDALREE